MSNLDYRFKNNPISKNAEDEALDIILMFSKVSLLLANIERDKIKQQSLIKNAMSIILPVVSQFYTSFQKFTHFFMTILLTLSLSSLNFVLISLYGIQTLVQMQQKMMIYLNGKTLHKTQKEPLYQSHNLNKRRHR